VTRKRKSTDLLKRTKKVSKSTLADDIVAGFEQAIGHNRGEVKLRTRVIHVPDDVDVHAIREKTGLSQFQFAERYGFNPRTLQEWEQGRTKPDSAVRAYLTVIDRNPEAVQIALNHQ
jgi:putative transcriptional regulator